MKTIVIAEDEKSFLDAICDELVDSGYKVFGASTCEQCLDLLNTVTPDLVIVDIKLPAMGGLKLLEDVRKKFASVPVIMCTAYDSFKTEYEIWISKVSDYIIKPVDLDDFRSKIRKILGE